MNAKFVGKTFSFSLSNLIDFRVNTYVNRFDYKQIVCNIPMKCISTIFSLNEWIKAASSDKAFESLHVKDSSTKAEHSTDGMNTNYC